MCQPGSSCTSDAQSLMMHVPANLPNQVSHTTNQPCYKSSADHAFVAFNDDLGRGPMGFCNSQTAIPDTLAPTSKSSNGTHTQRGQKYYPELRNLISPASEARPPVCQHCKGPMLPAGHGVSRWADQGRVSPGPCCRTLSLLSPSEF